MKNALMIAAATAAHFFRAGRKWTKDGTVVMEGDLSEAQMAVLESEPNIHIRRATPQEVEAHMAAHQADGADDLIEVLVSEIMELPPTAFGKDGLPKLTDLRRASSLDDEQVTAARRDAAMEKLLAGGFKAPSAS